jgi:protein-S-isoprenylcysteine O-methyltransferase Ste14
MPVMTTRGSPRCGIQATLYYGVEGATRLFQWTGGALFVASLGVCAWFYFVALGADVPRTGVGAIAADTALVTVFACHHSVFARDPIKQRLTMVPSHLRRPLYVWIASLLLVAVCLLWQSIGGRLYHVTGPRALLHAAVQIAGLLLIARSVAFIDPLQLAGIRPAGPFQAESDALQTKGPYRLVRHPLYLGWMLTVFGAARMTGDRFVFAVLTGLYLVIAVPWEERALLRSFGDEYASYRRLVRWRIVPFVY